MNSSHDLLEIVAGIITVKAPNVLGAAAKRQGIPLNKFMDTLPKSISKPLMQIRVMHARYSTGDYTHSDIEIGQCERIVQYLSDTHQEANGHPTKPFKIVKDGPQGVNSKQRLTDGKYPNGKPHPPGSLYRVLIAHFKLSV